MNLSNSKCDRRGGGRREGTDFAFLSNTADSGLITSSGDKNGDVSAITWRCNTQICATIFTVLRASQVIQFRVSATPIGAELVRSSTCT